ncbi:MAG: universal stress protein [Vicinamibacterales bacterium]
MIRIANVLCPVDFSETSQRALDHAAAIAHWYEARLTLLHVVVSRPVLDLPMPELTDADRERLSTDLRKMAGRIPPQVAIDYRISEAEFVDTEIVAQIAATQANLLVLGTHGRSGFERLFLGSVTEKLLRRATCPTLVVPPRAAAVAADAPVQLRRILCPVDFSDGSLNALTTAIGMAEEADARLTLLNVIEIPPTLFGTSGMSETDVDRIRAAAEADVLRRLRALVPEGARTYCSVETAVVEGSAHREIVRSATDARADVIVIGAHGGGTLDRLVFGSTTHHVIRAAPCPVLVVRSAT